MRKFAAFRTVLTASTTVFALGCGGIGVVGGQEAASTEKRPAGGAQCFGTECIDTLKQSGEKENTGATTSRTNPETTPEPTPPQPQPPQPPEPPEPKTQEECVDLEEVICDHIPRCNKHRGDDYDACVAKGNTGGCTEEQFYAHCRRRVDPEPGNDWYRIHEEWVQNRCEGEVDFVENSQGKGIYSCNNETACKRYVCITPIVLQFNDGEIALRSFVAEEAASFDLSAAQDNSAARTDWPTAATPWLALDRDGDGAITSGRELFGSATFVNGSAAEHGFEALAALDADGNGAIDAADPAFASLRLWADQNGDRVSQPNELQDLCAAGVTSLSLAYVISPRCDLRGNCAIERAPFTYRSADGTARSGSAIDLHLVAR